MSEDKSFVFFHYWLMLSPGHAPRLTPEYSFSKPLGRKHRFDFAFVEKKIAIEIEGNAWHVAGGGRHMQDSDLEKYNLAASLGWRVLRFSPMMIKRDPQGCIDIVLKTLEDS